MRSDLSKELVTIARRLKTDPDIDVRAASSVLLTLAGTLVDDSGRTVELMQLTGAFAENEINRIHGLIASTTN